MNVAELIRELSKLPADMPVVVAQEDEPLGNYGCTGVEVLSAKRDESWRRYREVWYGAGADATARVAFLTTDEPLPVVVDADDRPPAEVSRPSAGELGNQEDTVNDLIERFPGSFGLPRPPWPVGEQTALEQATRAELINEEAERDDR